MSGYNRQPPGRKGKTLIIQDDSDKENPDEGNPFSFKEFVRSKNFPLPAGRDCDGDFSIEARHGTTVLPEPQDKLALSSQYHQDTFFKDPTVDHDLLEDDDDDEEEEEEDWSGSYHPSVVEQTLNVSTSPDSIYNESYAYSDISRDQFTTRRTSPAADGYPNPEPPTSAAKIPANCVLFQNKQMTYEEVLEENNCLKRKIEELQKRNESQAVKVKHFEQKLEEKILEEQKEAQYLESMVQQVEANLQMMTKRAAKAESNATKLKQEVTLLQIQLNTFKSENEALRRGETAGMIAVKQNAGLALENLHKAVSGAQSSIRQLLSGGEALNLVAELLRSIDRIAEVHDDGS